MGDTPLLRVPSDFANNVKASTPVPDDSASQHSETAHDYITSQLQLEADAREALPYSFSHCTQPLGPLKQNLFSCLTCNTPDSPTFQPAAVCYSCSIACHGEHTLVELFSRRNFTCDCGTTRLPDECPCTLRINPATGMKGPVRGEKAIEGNSYNQNCKNRFCGCGEVYDPHQEKGTMFQCLGLSQEKDGGCGEDWWHPECVVGLGRKEWAERQPKKDTTKANADEGDIEAADGDEDEEPPLPPGFPDEDAFDAFICYKCVDANPWIKRYAGTDGFLPAVYHQSPGAQHVDKEPGVSSPAPPPALKPVSTTTAAAAAPSTKEAAIPRPEKRTATDADLDLDNDTASSLSKNPKLSTDNNNNSAPTATTTDSAPSPPPPTAAYHTTLPPATNHPHPLSLFLHSTFRTHLCRCPACYPLLSQLPQLLEEDPPLYEPPLSSPSDSSAASPSTQRSLLSRGEAALLSNVDRVRAIEGVMVYNQLRDKVRAFLQPFAESGKAVGAEDVKAYFAQLRGDDNQVGRGEGEVEVEGEGGPGMGGGGEGGQEEKDQRREQGGY